jgi:hypothetical protein
MTSEPKKAATRRKAKRRTAQRTPERKAVTKPYEPTPEERAAVEAMLARKKELPVAPSVKVSQRAGGVLELGFEHKDLKTADALLMGAVTTALVKYDAMCAAIDHAYQVDEVKDIRDKALAFEAYARQAHNIEAERQACDIRIRAEKKGGQLLRAMRKTKGRPRTAAPSAFQKAINAAGLSKDQAKRWQQLAGVSEEDFEDALAGPDKPSRGKIIAESKTKPEKKSKRPPMDEDTLWLWGRLRDFENRGLLSRPFNEVLGFGTDAMRADIQRLVGPVSHWLKGNPSAKT